MRRILGRIQNATFILARRYQELEFDVYASTQRRRRRRQKVVYIQAPPKPQIRPEKAPLDGPSQSLFQEISRFALQDDPELSLESLRRPGDNFFALSRVNHLFRAEFLGYIETRLSFDFTWDAAALPVFCAQIAPIHRQRRRYIEVDFVDEHSPSPSSTTFGSYLSANLPNLRTVFLTLIPRDPRPNCRNLSDFRWGQHIKDFLFSLGDLKATVILTLRWKNDCDYFEKEYVGSRGWRCIQFSEAPDEPEPWLVMCTAA